MSIFSNPAARSSEEAGEYTKALLGLLGDRDPMQVLRETPAAIRAILDGVPASLAMTPEAPGKWSIAMVAQHLADSELVWGSRVRMIIAHDRPAIAGYDQDAWATRLRYAESPLEPALADFEAVRGANLRLLARVPESDRERVGIHAERGEESVAHMIRMSAGHDVLHIRQIERILASVRSA
jgi:hypothetical protein